MRFCIFLTCFFASCDAALALAVPDDSKLRGEMVVALEALFGSDQDDRFFKGNVSEPEKKQESIYAGGTEISFNTAGLTKDFRGNFEIASQPNSEEFAIVSTDDNLPTIAVYDNGQDTYQSISFRGESVSAGLLLSDLSQLINRKSLLKFIGRAKGIKKTTEDSGETVYTCPLSKRILRDSPTDLMAVNGKVKSVEATVTVKDGLIGQIKFSVTRFNLFAQTTNASSDAQPRVQTQQDAALPGGLDFDKVLSAQLKDPVVVYKLTPIETPSDPTSKIIEQLRASAEAN